MFRFLAEIDGEIRAVLTETGSSGSVA